MATTALELIEAGMSKLSKLGAGETASAEDTALGLKRLNALMTSLENEGMFNYTTTRTTTTLAAGVISRTIGPAMNFAMIRPMKILRGSYSRLNGIDYEIEPVSEQEYNSISQKDGVDAVAPLVCWYNGGTPTGTVYFWPGPSESVSVTLITPAPGGVATSVSTSYDFPPGYQLMVEYNLAVEMAPDFNVTPSQLVAGKAVSSKRLVKRTNSWSPRLDLPDWQMTRGTIPISDFISGEF